VAPDPGPHRIGEFARRVGVSPELLRAWERRYGLVAPVRSAGGFRLYGDADAERVSQMRSALASGLSAAEAARTVLAPGPVSEGLLEDSADRMLAAIRSFDESAVHAALDDSLAAFGIEAVLRAVVLPVLTEVGAGWEQGVLDISQEHFASNLIRGRLMALARLWGRGAGPLAVLACAPGEAHDISLIAFGLVLRSHGWRVLFLGADTPLETLGHAVAATEPSIVVVTSFDSRLLLAEATALRRLGRHAAVLISGPGGTDAVAKRLGLPRLNGDLVAAASEVARA
jgi:MerR family transcriptional regulator, light-induced transcriptional regulator